MPKEKHNLIVVPGLGDGERWLSFILRQWSTKYGIEPHMHVMSWADNSKNYAAKQDRLLNLIDELSNETTLLSLLGLSGGGSAVLNAYALRLDSIHKVVNVCGRLQVGQNVTPTLEQAGRGKPAFIESVKTAESNLPDLNNQQKSRILTIRPKYDEAVPISTVPVEGAQNIEINSVTHVLSIALALLFPRQIVGFLRN
jgi:pimeloyl-ACP methyl ester carboxylesterase